MFPFCHFHRARTGFDKSSLERLESLFKKTVGNEKEIHLEEFKNIVTSKNVSKMLTLYIYTLYYNTILTLQPFFTERVFQIFDKDDSGSISLQEFIDSIHQFSGQSADDKIRFLFKVYDIDGLYLRSIDRRWELYFTYFFVLSIHFEQVTVWSSTKNYTMSLVHVSKRMVWNFQRSKLKILQWLCSTMPIHNTGAV